MSSSTDRRACAAACSSFDQHYDSCSSPKDNLSPECVCTVKGAKPQVFTGDLNDCTACNTQDVGGHDLKTYQEWAVICNTYASGDTAKAQSLAADLDSKDQGSMLVGDFSKSLLPNMKSTVQVSTPADPAASRTTDNLTVLASPLANSNTSVSVAEPDDPAEQEGCKGRPCGGSSTPAAASVPTPAPADNPTSAPADAPSPAPVDAPAPAPAPAPADAPTPAPADNPTSTTMPGMVMTPGQTMPGMVMTPGETMTPAPTTGPVASTPTLPVQGSLPATPPVSGPYPSPPAITGNITPINTGTPAPASSPRPSSTSGSVHLETPSIFLLAALMGVMLFRRRL